MTHREKRSTKAVKAVCFCEVYSNQARDFAKSTNNFVVGIETMEF